jgi:multidrug efflux pump subunit AcrA (membrane-fusion protein)
VADSFDESGFFRKDDALVQIDRRDYEVRIRRLEASLEATHAQLAEAEKYLGRLDRLRESSAATEVEYDRSKATYDVAVARSAELAAQLEEAQNAFSDTTVVAPYDGCIRKKHADLGQFVTMGTPLADCFATDVVEVRLPVDDREFAFLGLPLGVSLPEDRSPEVTLEADFSGTVCRWKGTIVRTEAFVDPRSRMVYLVVHVRDPYRKRAKNLSQNQSELLPPPNRSAVVKGFGIGFKNGEQPLAVGMFVEATIDCPPIDGVVLLPEWCVSHDGKLFLIGPEGTLVQKVVEVVRREETWVVVRGDLEDGQRVCATQLANPLEGMRVVIDETISLDSSGVDERGLVDLSAGVRFASLVEDGKAGRE